MRTFLANSTIGKASDPNERASHIIVVDDDSALRQILTVFLEDHNVSVTPASSRAELNRHIEKVEPSLIILDLHLGRDDGLEILRDIRSSSDVPVVAMTGHRLDEVDRIVGLELGADDYVVKPFNPREMLARVRAVRPRLHIFGHIHQDGGGGSGECRVSLRRGDDQPLRRERPERGRCHGRLSLRSVGPGRRSVQQRRRLRGRVDLGPA